MEDIIAKVIEKTVENGWENPYPHYLLAKWETDKAFLTGMLLSHEFVKAYFGEDPKHFYPHWEPTGKFDGHKAEMAESIKTITNWEHHLKILVLEEDKIEYLKRFL